jgi:hypothetical protein
MHALMRLRSISPLLLAAAACSRTPKTPQEALPSAVEYLWSQQAKDGGWHSRTYGLLRSGQALTPFVLNALLKIPPAVYPAQTARADRAIAFIAGNTRADGALGLADSIPDYPNYSTALAVSALCRARRGNLGGAGASAWPRICARSSSLHGTKRWRREHPVYGAWRMGGEPRTPPDTGHVDLSMTRYVLQALRAAGVAVNDPLFASARVFVERRQNFDPQHADRADGEHFRSYGTTTADGILALLAVGSPLADPRVVAARRWLMSHHSGMAVPGFVGEAYQRWPQGLAFYYAASSGEAFRALGVDPGPSVIDALKRTQRADGSWANPEKLVKEDDPLIATAFAVRALLEK